MASITAGDYIIVPAANTANALDVSGGSLKDGANVQTYTQNGTAAQVFSVSYRTDGTAQITSRLTGKSIDVNGGSLVSGTNVQMWTDNDTRAQQWEIVDASSTATIGGVSYALFGIRLSEVTTLYMDVAGGSSNAGANVEVYTGNGSNAQKWAFVPVPPFQSGGVYELRSMLDKRMCLDVAGGSTANGANCQLYTANGTNAQKFVFEHENDGWAIRNIATGKYVDVSGGTFANGSNIQSYEDNDTRAQRWEVIAYSTTTVEGKTCQIVGIGAGNAHAYMMDVASAMRSNNTNVQIYQSNGSNAQRWALYPTEAEDPQMPTPHTLGLAKTVGNAPLTVLGATMANGGVSKRLYPAWSCSDAWATDGPNHYEWRYRTRKMYSSSSAWGDWSSWTAWQTANVTQDGVNARVTEGVLFEYDLDDYKSMQFDMEVRSVGVESYALLHGPSAGETCTIAPMPTVTLSDGAWDGGLKFPCTCDYDAGKARIQVTSVKSDGRELLLSPISCEVSDSILITPGMLSGLPITNATVAFTVGTDQVSLFDDSVTQIVGVSYGGTADPPTITYNDDLTATAIAPSGTRMWVSADGLRECKVISDNGTNATFEVIYPLGTEYWLLASDGTDSWYSDMPAKGKRVHIWNWDGGFFMLECRKDTPLETSYNIKAVYKEYTLVSRKRGSVYANKTFSGSFKADGATIPNVTNSDVETAIALQEAVHAVYRSPNGWVRDVAVTSIVVVENKHYAVITVDMIEEAI